MPNCPGAELSHTGAELSLCRSVQHSCINHLVIWWIIIFWVSRLYLYLYAQNNKFTNLIRKEIKPYHTKLYLTTSHCSFSSILFWFSKNSVKDATFCLKRNWYQNYLLLKRACEIGQNKSYVFVKFRYVLRLFWLLFRKCPLAENLTCFYPEICIYRNEAFLTYATKQLIQG